MTAPRDRRRPDNEAAIDAYVQRVIAAFPPFSEERRLRLCRLVTPPRRGLSSTTTGHEVRDVRQGGGQDVAT